MPGPGTKNVPLSAARKPALPEALTPAGRITEQYAAGRLAHPAAPAATPAGPKLTPARVRAAREQAQLGSRFARDGRYVQAIDRLNRAAELDPTVPGVYHDLGLSCLRAGRLQDAVTALRRAAALAPDLLSAHLHLGTALDLLEREREAFAAYEAVITLDPGHHPTLARLAQIQVRNGRFVDAQTRFTAAAAAAEASDSPRAGIYAALAARVAGRLAEAETILRGVIAMAPGLGEAHAALGQILAETGRSDEATGYLERCITLDPTMVAAWQNLAASKKFTIGDQPLLDRMTADLQRPDLTGWQRQAVHFALGKAFDDLRDHAAAMRHFEAANQIRGAHKKLDRARLAHQTDHVIATAPPGFLDRRTDLSTEDATPILIVGMPRSGTTLTEQIISSHPDVAAGGELSFWRERNRAGLGVFAADARPEAAQRLARDYLEVLRAISPDAPRVTDKMPFNFAHLGVIRQVFPRAAIVHCRRHPIDVCLSIFSTNFDAAFDFAADRGSLVFFYREYLRLMAHWRAVLPPERFIEVDYEALVADPEPQTRRLIAACGLSWDDACLSPHRNQRQISTASLWQARQPIYRTAVERWRRYEPWLQELRLLLEDAGTEAGHAT